MRKDNAGTPRSRRFAEGSRLRVGQARKLELTTPDLVLLSLLAERPMHGYQANQELERREIRDWANLSRPQVYYSLEKLAKRGLLRSSETEEPTGGPERSTFETTAKGRETLATALELESWTQERERPPFLTWMALSWQARPGIFLKQLKRRRKFLLREIAREKKTLLSIYAEVGHKYHEAVWMVGLMIEQLRVEVRWTHRLEHELARRAKALNPEFAEGLPK
ncbi:MAG TPA: PadR family transcriptional regulator [Candidatus Acidoferrum sp.]|nr:PadR family transcriptional regulator [Candidatus Acidoferrum sp.]